MNAQTDNIDLGPLYEPAPVGFHFETIGWPILFSILGVLVIVILLKVGLNYYQNAYRRQAIHLINTIENRFQSEQEVACINDMMVVLKQVSLTTYSRNEVADLAGTAWLEFLESKAKGASFLKYDKVLSQALYQDKIEQPEEVKQLFASSKKWISHHT
jgi:hypothetical protein